MFIFKDGEWVSLKRDDNYNKCSDFNTIQLMWISVFSMSVV